MKIQCNVCEAAEAAVLCCADEAALCFSCDRKVHAANKLVSKHQRVTLSTSNNQMPKCDNCQETVGYFFCLEDRALLCRKCDVSIHTTNSFASKHQRFLLTGVRVGVEATSPPVPSSSSGKKLSYEKISEKDICFVPKKTAAVSSNGQNSRILPVQESAGSDFASPKVQFAGGSANGNMSPWQFDEFLGLGDFNQSYNLMENDSSKADSCSDKSPVLRVADEQLEVDDGMGHLPGSFWAVPQIPSPPTASGLHWPKDPYDSAVFVPDITSSGYQNVYHHHQSRVNSSKKRRHT